MLQIPFEDTDEFAMVVLVDRRDFSVDERGRRTGPSPPWNLPIVDGSEEVEQDVPFFRNKVVELLLERESTPG